MAVTHCAICHRLLTDPYSVAMGIGPECRGKMKGGGHSFPKPKWKVSGGKVIFDGAQADLTPPPTPLHRKNTDGEGSRDAKREIVRRALRAGGTKRQARDALYDYMREKDSPMSLVWCEWFVEKVVKEMKR